MLKTGVYTVECPKCKNYTIVHLASEGSINPHKCSKCELEFKSIRAGKQRNTFVAIASEAGEITKTSELNEEMKKTGKKSYETFQSNKRTGDKSVDTFTLSNKKDTKKSFEW